VFDRALPMVVDRPSAFAQASKKTRHFRPLHKAPDAHGVDLVHRHEQVSAAVFKNSQLVKGNARSAKSLLDDRANDTRAVTRINNFLSNYQHIVLLPLVSSPSH